MNADKKITDVTDNNVGKITDSEIVKALECCIIQCSVCKQCPLLPIKDNRGKCYTNLKKQALDLINRLQEEKEEYIKDYEELEIKLEYAKTETEFEKQRVEYLQAENEQLTKDKENLAYSLANAVGQKMTAKAEAYKEFAKMAIDRVEKVKAKYQRLCKEQGEEMEEHMHIHFNGITKIIKNLLKELVGEDNESKNKQ